MRRLIVVVLAAVVFALLALPAVGQGRLEVVSDRFDASGFPNELQFAADLRGDGPIERAELVMQLGSCNVSVIRPATLTRSGEGTAASVSLNIQGDAHIPPGTAIRYRWRAIVGGASVESEPKELVYLDPRFQWQRLQDGIFSVYYYNQPEARARRVIDAIKSTNDRMGALLGVRIDRETKAVMYNSKPEMDPALRFRSATTTRELVTEGVAYHQFDLFLTIGDNPETISHEFVHLLVGKVADTLCGGIQVPAWVNEGLAVMGQSSPGEYLTALQRGVRENRLLPLRGLDGPPGTPEQVILFYGQGYSAMMYLIDTYGDQKMRDLLAAIRVNRGTAGAIQQTYGKNLDAIDNEWRLSIGAQPLPGSGPAPAASPTAQSTAQPKAKSATPTPAAATKAQQTPPVSKQPVGAQATGDSNDVLIVAAVGGVFVLFVAGIGVIAIAAALRNRG